MTDPIPEMVPSAKERVTARWHEGQIGRASIVQWATTDYCDGVLAGCAQERARLLAKLREPSDEMIVAIAATVLGLYDRDRAILACRKLASLLEKHDG